MENLSYEDGMALVIGLLILHYAMFAVMHSYERSPGIGAAMLSTMKPIVGSASILLGISAFVLMGSYITQNLYDERGIDIQPIQEFMYDYFYHGGWLFLAFISPLFGVLIGKRIVVIIGNARSSSA